VDRKKIQKCLLQLLEMDLKYFLVNLEGEVRRIRSTIIGHHRAYFTESQNHRITESQNHKW